MSRDRWAAIEEQPNGTLHVIYDNDVSAPINPHDLRDAGWMPGDECSCDSPHCDDESCDCTPDVTPALDVVARWHNDHHDGASKFCDEGPCRDLREAFRQV